MHVVVSNGLNNIHHIKDVYFGKIINILPILKGGCKLLTSTVYINTHCKFILINFSISNCGVCFFFFAICIYGFH